MVEGVVQQPFRLGVPARQQVLLGQAQPGPGLAEVVPQVDEEREDGAGGGGRLLRAGRQTARGQREPGVRGVQRIGGRVADLRQDGQGLVGPAERQPGLAEAAQRRAAVRSFG